VEVIRKWIEVGRIRKFGYHPSLEEPNVQQSLLSIDESEQRKILYIGGWVL